MVSLLERITLVSLCNLRITLAVCLASHCKIHTYLATLTCKVILQTLDNLLIDAILICLTENVYSSECQIIIHCIFHLLELAGWSLANRALLWCLSTLIDVTTNGANKFLLHNVNVLKMFLYCIILLLLNLLSDESFRLSVPINSSSSPSSWRKLNRCPCSRVVPPARCFHLSPWSLLPLVLAHRRGR